MNRHYIDRYKQDDFYYTTMAGTCKICKCTKSHREGMYHHNESTSMVCMNCFYHLPRRGTDHSESTNSSSDGSCCGGACLGIVILMGMALVSTIKYVVEWISNFNF